MMNMEHMAQVVQDHRNDALRQAEQNHLARIAMQSVVRRHRPLRVWLARTVGVLAQYLKG